MEKEKEYLIQNIINGLVRDEWEAVDGYDSAIATLSEAGLDDVVAIMEDIRDEEYVHIGQLESCLSLISGNPTEQIEDGSEEGFEQLELPEEDEEVELELNETFNPTANLSDNAKFVDSFYKKHKKLIDKLGE